MTTVPFMRSDIVDAATALKMDLPKNLGDVIYTFRFRGTLPEAVQRTAPSGKEWSIVLQGHGSYAFVAAAPVNLIPSGDAKVIRLPDSTPGLITRYALSDEQALLAKLRYNRLLDIFIGTACYSLQNHLRTTVPGVGQIETDEVYIGLDDDGAHYVMPIQAKGGNDRLHVVQIEQDFMMCSHKFPNLTCRPVAAQFTKGNVIVLFEFGRSDDAMKIVKERHYELVPQEEISDEELLTYGLRR